MRALALGAVLVCAKLSGVAGQILPLSIWTPVALFWHDITIVLVFWIVDRRVGRPRIMWAVYAALVVWTVANLISVRALSSPLTMPMLGAAGSALTDSIWHYATVPNVLLVLLVLLVAAAGAGLVRAAERTADDQSRRPSGSAVIAATGAVALIALGPVAMARVDVRGLHRNGVTALAATSLPRLSARSMVRDWRISPVTAAAAPDEPTDSPDGTAYLNAIRGAGAGRNVIVIVLESTAARYLYSYGATDDPTPRLTALTERSVQFERAYAVYPESIKGLFSTLCSRAPAFDVPAERHAEVPCASLPRRLSAAGYRTALFHSGRFSYLGMEAMVRQHRFDVAEDAGDIGGVRESSFGVDEMSTVKRVLSWIDAATDGRPFFTMYMPTAGHHPYATRMPGPFQGDGDLVAYKNALHEGDASLGALFDGLAARGLDRNTVLVIYGDHGEAFGQHAGNYAHSLFLYDENVRVPLWFVVPGATHERRRVQRVASLVDVGPTLLDVLGIVHDAAGDGRSLLGGARRMALFYTDYSSPWLGLQDGCLKYLYDMDRGSDRVFDTCRDAGESVDLSAAAGPKARDYREHVIGWAESVRGIVLAGP